MSTPAAVLPWPPSPSTHWVGRFWQASQNRLRQILHTCRGRQKMELFGLGLGLASLVVALLAWFRLTQQLSQWTAVNQKITADTQVSLTPEPTNFSNSATNSGSTVRDTLTVYITGAVRKPGIYRLSSSSLVMDAVTAANGFSSDIWQDYLDQFINLAEPLSNYQKIWIPKLNQQSLLIKSETNFLDSSEEVPTDSPSQDSESLDSNLVSINSATVGELINLKGIGQKRAEDIVAGRPYQTLNELVTKAKIPASIYQAIATQLKL